MAYQIQSLSVGGVLDHSFRLIRDHFLLLWGIAAVVYVPAYAIFGNIEPLDPSTGQPTALLGVFGFAGILFLAGFPLVQGAIFHAVSEAYLGNEVSLGDAFAKARGIYLRFLGTSMLVGLGVMLGLFLLVIPGLYVMVAWLVVGPVVVLEGSAGPTAIGRSRALVRDNWWRVLGIFTVVAILAFILAGAFDFVFSNIPFLGGALSGAVNALAFAFNSCATVVLYFDLRCRHEDFDLQVLAQQVGSSPVHDPASPVR